MFDEPNLVADAGLVALVRLAERSGLPVLVRGHLKIRDAANSGGANPEAKVMSLVAGMCAGADSIEDLHRLRHGAMNRLFDGVRAPSTAGTFLRSFTHGHARQLHRIHRAFLAVLARHTPLLPDAGTVAFLDVDPTHRRVYGYAKQGAEVGRLKGQRTLHPILATVATPTARPVIAATRLRRGKAADARGAASFTAEALAATRQAGASGTVVMRADSQFYNADVIAACRRAGAHFSVTVPMNPYLTARIASIPETAWTPIRYPQAFVDEDTGQMVSDAEVAECEYTAFTGRTKALQVTARLIVRRIRRINTKAAQGQGELFTAWRYHPVFTDSPFELLQAELQHRQHAVVEQVIADGKAGPLAHLPSGHFQANNAWLTLWAISYNLLRAAGSLAGTFHTKATTATIRTHLIHVPARLARSARRLVLHLPRHWPWQHAFTGLFTQAHAPPVH